ncbi:hypothetical protein AFERRI_560211 [Acidithiobacillus ferrivorans]|uniref:Uncharacterized protein n=1 Tax=Acidithiobacillus ferrivorans TaxID=160808 RepID=A0A060USR5_9PROT|nr:hypothetical protein AFERRI_560211 [Acidithiobacillus ferrivorans]
MVPIFRHDLSYHLQSQYKAALGSQTIHHRIGTYYRDTVTDYEVLNIQRNTARLINKLIKFGFLLYPA